MGIYVHIPFCKSKCYYCGFYSVASETLKSDFTNALINEIKLRKNYLEGEIHKTLYFGGGTPSYMDTRELSLIIKVIEDNFNISSDAERTIECNPDDLSEEKLQGLKALGFNRISMGAQTFHDELLKKINRRHTSIQAINAINMAKKVGFDNISVDLMMGLPDYSTTILNEDLDIIATLPITHLSIYLLSIDEGTVFFKLKRDGKLNLPDEDEFAEYYKIASKYLSKLGFEHYEISNFAKDGKYSLHNTSYWEHISYIGLGPSAHSFNLKSRSWNVSNIKRYIENVKLGKPEFEEEILSRKDKYDEYIMTSLRTMWGANTNFLKTEFPEYWNVAKIVVQNYIKSGDMLGENEFVRLSEQGWLISDMIFRDLFADE